MNTQLNDVSKHPNVVVIIGNGFDLSMELKTSYKDFVKSKYFKCILEKNETLLMDCLDFKRNNSKIALYDNGLAKWVQNVTTIQNWVDLEVEIGKYCKSNGHNRDSETIRKEIFAIRYFFYKYLYFEIERTQSSIKDMTDYFGYEFIKQLLNYKDAFHIWNFNYTFTLGNILAHNQINGQEISEIIENILTSNNTSLGIFILS